MSHRILIVGGGFGGVSAALHLAKKKLPDTKITLITPTPFLEYYGVLYRLIGGKSPAEAAIPLTMILKETSVQLTIDSITGIDPANKTVSGKSGSAYVYDTLILAPGSVPAYFGIPGMQEHSITMKSVEEALTLQRLKKELAPDSRVIVVGAGPTGCEIAGEFAGMHKVDLVEAMDRVLPVIEPKASTKALKRLQKIGVNVMLQQAVAKADAGSITFKDGTTRAADLLIWTAGVKAHDLIATIPGIEVDNRGRAVVDEQLRAKGQPDIFVLGDCAATPFAGLAQTAYDNGIFAARVIAAQQSKSTVPVYKPKPTAYAIPIGPWWAAVKFGPLRTYGITGYIMRRAADIHVYNLILPWFKVPAAYFGKISLGQN